MGQNSEIGLYIVGMQHKLCHLIEVYGMLTVYLFVKSVYYLEISRGSLNCIVKNSNLMSCALKIFWQGQLFIFRPLSSPCPCSVRARVIPDLCPCYAWSMSVLCLVHVRVIPDPCPFYAWSMSVLCLVRVLSVSVLCLVRGLSSPCYSWSVSVLYLIHVRVMPD